LYSAAVLEILRPFLFYVFLEPLQSTQYNNTRTGLWRVLLAAARCDQHVLEFIVSLLPHVP
ncbi:focadhesin, partial [Biomphalaria glabrata]